MKRFLCTTTKLLLGSVTTLLGLSMVMPSASAENNTTVPTFSVAQKSVIDFEDISRRKWGNPVIADLDRDGNLDLILTEHAKHAQVFWNDGGTFARPVKLINGDTHGVTLGDIDQDGRVEVIVIPGGGGGKKPSSPILFHVGLNRSIDRAKPLQGFQNSRGRAGKLVDVDNDGSLELITTAFEGVDRGGDINFLYENDNDGSFRFVRALPRAPRMGFRTQITDFNNDGDFDLIFHGGPEMAAVQGGPGLEFTAAVPGLAEKSVFCGVIVC